MIKVEKLPKILPSNKYVNYNFTGKLNRNQLTLRSKLATECTKMFPNIKAHQQL